MKVPPKGDIQDNFVNIYHRLSNISEQVGEHPLSDHFSLLSEQATEAIAKLAKTIDEGYDFKPEGKMIAFLYQTGTVDGTEEPTYAVKKFVDKEHVGDGPFFRGWTGMDCDTVKERLISEGYQVFEEPPPGLGLLWMDPPK